MANMNYKLEKFQHIGVDRLLNCINTKEVSQTRETSCKICRRYNFDIPCSKCYIDQTAEQLIVLFAEREK